VSTSVKTPRRHALLKSQGHRLQQNEELAATWKAKQQAIPGTALPASFPLQARLAVAGYSTVEDLDGTDEDELVRAGLTQREAQTTMAALAALL
jgi:hypothetical protein